MTATELAMRHIESCAPRLRQDNPEVADIATVWWEFAGMLQLEGVFDDLEQADANLAAEGVLYTFVIIEDVGSAALRTTCDGLLTGEIPSKFHDLDGAIKSLLRVADMAEQPIAGPMPT